MTLITKKHSLLVIDDHRLFNDGLKTILKNFGGFNKIKQLYDSREAIETIKTFEPDLIILDFNMPHINGLELCKLILSQFPSQAILIVSMYEEERYIKEFQKIGAKGYLSKSTSTEEMKEVILKIQAGEEHFIFQNKHVEERDNFLKKVALSERELEIIQLLKKGLKTKEIAEVLFLSFFTVETHRKKNLSDSFMKTAFSYPQTIKTFC
jgi:DNA-binding NarL/FixJ family response regulator